MNATAPHDTAPHDTDVIIIGTGFSGLAMGTRLKRAGFDDFLLLERAAAIGGTWRDNTYPGAACDIQSHLYSYSFRPNPDWSRVYAGQSEILQYLEDTADEEGLRGHIRFRHEVSAATWDDETARWTVVAGGHSFSCRILVTASGHLSDPKIPELPGIGEFRGTIFHSARWDHSADLRGKRVGVVGTGASAIQIVPAIAPEAEHVTVFQRSAPYVIPRVDREYSDVEKQMFRKVPAKAQELRDELFWWNESRFPQRRLVPDFLAQIRALADRHRQQQISDPELMRKVTPDYEVGCKRILISNDWYPALERDDVSLETSLIERMTPDGAVLTDGREEPLDVLVLSTGFEASDLPIAYRIFGRGGRSLAGHWAEAGEQAYACTTVTGFPNLFVMLGPNTGLGAGSIIFMVETQAQYILEAVGYMTANGVRSLEVPRSAEEHYARSLVERSEGTVWVSGGCKSWYLDRNGRLTTLWPDFMTEFRRENGSFRPEAYVVDGGGRTKASMVDSLPSAHAPAE
ncbi:flavin-containing monooxygenase [Kocuria sp. M1R5S2]|uniref:flavin-containing monooxygenase n=1 Tax=Kocuria rhizosphaerae TaxID=3376285 RepID=UPI0037966D9D